MNKVTWKILLFSELFFLLSGITAAQESLSLQQAVEIAVKNNYSILIAGSQSEISTNDYSAGNAGMLPQLSLNASGNIASNNTKQHYSTGLDVNKSGVGSNVINVGPALNWTIFDGMKMFATYDKLREFKEMGELNVKIQIENTITDIAAVYFDIVRQKQILKAIQNAIEISDERLRIAEQKLSIGNGAYSDVLLAKVDRNEQKSALLLQKVTIDNTKINLNQLLSRSAETKFDVSDSMIISYNPNYENLKTTSVAQNRSVLFAQKNLRADNFSLKELNAQRLPKIGLNANYNLARTENEAGLILLNQNLGFNAGFTASWNLFNGWNVNRQIKNAKIYLQIDEIHLKDISGQVEASLLAAYTNFQNALEVLKLEEETNLLAKESTGIAVEKFRLSGLTALELKNVQKSLLDSETRLVSAKYTAKLAETQLMKLNGDLVK